MISSVHPPGPRRAFPGTHLLALQRNPAHFLQGLAEAHGDIVCIQIGPRLVYLLNHPDYIADMLVTHQRSFVKGRMLEQSKWLLGNGLLTSEGAQHLQQRRLVQPAFHRQRVAAYAETMVAYAAQTRDQWHENAVIDMDQAMMRLTLDIVAKTLFDAEIGAEGTAIGAAISTVMRHAPMRLLPFADQIERLPIPALQRVQQARAQLDTTIERLIAEHRAGGDRGDVLSLLLAQQGDMALSDRQVRDETLTLFLAGHETTANALTWAWHLLAQHPDVQAALHHELTQVLGNRLPTGDDVAQLPYTRMVLAETLRLYPPAWAIGRRAVADVPIGSYTIPAGATVVASPYVMHRDQRYYPNPERFDPQRWQATAKEVRPRFSFFPFGGGTRICIGEQFAWLEGVLLIATIAQRWHMQPVPGHPVALQPLMTLRPKYGMRLGLKQRGGYKD